MQSVDSLYQSLLQEWTPAQRIARVCSLYHTMREMIRLDVCREIPELPDESDVRREIARRMYQAKPQVLELIKRI